jgi:hypothetical protein
MPKSVLLIPDRGRIAGSPFRNFRSQGRSKPRLEMHQLRKCALVKYVGQGIARDCICALDPRDSAYQVEGCHKRGIPSHSPDGHSGPCCTDSLAHLMKSRRESGNTLQLPSFRNLVTVKDR